MDFVVIGAEAFLYRAFPPGLRQRHRICEVRKKGETKKERGPLLWLGHATNWGCLIEIYHSYICLVEVRIIIYIYRCLLPFCIILFCFSSTKYKSDTFSSFSSPTHLSEVTRLSRRRWNRLSARHDLPLVLAGGTQKPREQRDRQTWYCQECGGLVGPAADSWTSKNEVSKKSWSGSFTQFFFEVSQKNHKFMSKDWECFLFRSFGVAMGRFTCVTCCEGSPHWQCGVAAAEMMLHFSRVAAEFFVISVFFLNLAEKFRIFLFSWYALYIKLFMYLYIWFVFIYIVNTYTKICSLLQTCLLIAMKKWDWEAWKHGTSAWLEKMQWLRPFFLD